MHHHWLQRISSLSASYSVLLTWLLKRWWKSLFWLKQEMRVGGLTGKQQRRLLKHFSERAIDCTNEDVSVIANSTKRRLQVSWNDRRFLDGSKNPGTESEPEKLSRLSLCLSLTVTIGCFIPTSWASFSHPALCKVLSSVPFAHSQLMAGKLRWTWLPRFDTKLRLIRICITLP